MAKQWHFIEGIWLAGLFLAAWVTFEPALNNTIHFDDVYQVRTIAVPQGLAGWARATAAPWWAPSRKKNLWRPVTRLSILAQKAFFGPTGQPYYAFNIVLHAAVGLLLFRLGRRLGWQPLAAGLGALIFVVHPIHSEVVLQVVGRAESLAAFWMLCGLLLFLRLGPRDPRSWLLQPLLFALALGSKEHALAYPGLSGLALLAGATKDCGLRNDECGVRNAECGSADALNPQAASRNRPNISPIEPERGPGRTSPPRCKPDDRPA
jgi:hypothetical protein